MKISAISNCYNNLSKKIQNKPKKQNISFGNVYVEDTVSLGDASISRDKESLPHFLKSDALLLNSIAQNYPNQDCFIRKGYGDFPRLEYREKPPEVQLFTASIFKPYKVEFNPDDEEYPSEPLILYKDSKLNRIIGLTSYISLNPSLPFTVLAGYELHKKLLAKKYEIKDYIGRGSAADLGEENLTKTAHKAIEDVETAVTRYLLECAYAVLKDKPSAQQIYASNYPKVQSRLDAKRRYDLTTSTASQQELSEKIILEKAKKTKNGSNTSANDNLKVDICEIAMAKYPNMQENKEVIKDLERYMFENKLILG